MKFIPLIAIVMATTLAGAQSLHVGMRPSVTRVTDADSTYIGTFTLPNDVRLLIGGQTAALHYGTTRTDDPHFSGTFNNANDVIGVGLTYKIIDFDMTFSSGQSSLFEAQNQSLDQFRLVVSYTMRKFSFRAFYTELEGMVSTNTDGDFTSNPDVKMVRTGVQVTYIANDQRFSYRAAHFQNEIQRRTAGSFLVRFEPFYRSLGTRTQFVPEPYDLPQHYDDQTGMHYLRAPGLSVMPGYAATFAIDRGKFFISPFVLAGPGIALNVYEGDTGRANSINTELAACAGVNAGYNGARLYGKIRCVFDAYYLPIDPAFFNTVDLSVMVVVGYRFANLERFIPTSLVRTR